MKDNGKIKNLLGRIREIADRPSGKNGKLSEICTLLRSEIPHYDWVGFYIVEGDELVLGPFDGEPTEHIKIHFGEGICGQAAEKKETFIVQDVSKEINYLSCSLKVKSEIVVPIFKDGKLVGELDIDSHTISPFTSDDKEFLERVCNAVSHLF